MSINEPNGAAGRPSLTPYQDAQKAVAAVRRVERVRMSFRPNVVLLNLRAAALVAYLRVREQRLTFAGFGPVVMAYPDARQLIFELAAIKSMAEAPMAPTHEERRRIGEVAGRAMASVSAALERSSGGSAA